MKVDDGRRKVGFSTSPERRSKEFRNLQIEFVSGWRDDISRLERLVHDALVAKGHSKDGEIFDAALDDIVDIINDVLSGVTFHVAPSAAEHCRTKKIIGLALDPKLLERLDKWRRSQDVPPTKTAVHETALREFLEKREGRRNG
jgi:hypothetical protein